MAERTVRRLPFGPGWSYSFGMYLDDRGDGTVTYTDDQGATIAFTFDSDINRFVAPPGSLGLRLSKCADGGFELRQIGGLTGEFDQSGRIVGFRQPGPRRDSRIDYQYDDAGRLLSVTGAHGRRIVLLYHTEGHLIREARDHTERRWQYTYNDNQELSEVIDPSGRRRRYEYAGQEWNVAVDRRASGRRGFRAMQRVCTLPFGTAAEAEWNPMVTNQYTSESRVHLQLDALGRSTRFEYNPYTKITSVTDPAGRTTVYCFDDLGNTTKIRQPSGATTEYVFDDQHNLLAEIDPLENKTTYVEFRDPKQLDCQKTYGRRAIGNRAGYLQFRVDDLACGYDEDGNRPLVRTAHGLTIRFEDYTEFGQPRRVIQPDGTVVQSEYDARSGLRRRSTHPLTIGRAETLNRVQDWTYDDFGNCLEHRTWAETLQGVRVTPIRVEAFAYDSTTQELESSKRWFLAIEGGDEFAAETHYKWDDLGRVIEIESRRCARPGSDFERRTRRFGYDVLDRRIWELQPDGGAVCLTYDVDGRVVEMQSVSGAEVDHLPDVTAAATRAVSTWQYDALGRETRFTDPLGRSTFREWDHSDRCIAIIDSAGRTTYEYDEDGHLTRTRTPEGYIVAVQYDANGAPKARSDSHGGEIRTDRDAIGRIVRECIGHADKAVTTYLYDDLGRSQQTVFADDSYEKVFFDELGGIVRRERGRSGGEPSRIELYEYDGLGRMLRAGLGAPETQVLEFQYRYSIGNHEVTTLDALGNETISFYDTEGSLVSTRDAEGRTARFDYDVLGRLTRHWSDDASLDASYSYDQGGQLVAASEGEIVYRWEYDSRGRVTTHLQEARGETLAVHYQYDDAGRVTEKRVDDQWWMRYSYGSSHGPRSVVLPHDTVQIEYDSAGRPTSEHWSSGVRTTYQYSPEGSLISLRRIDASGHVIWHQVIERDGRGRPIIESRSVGVVEAERSYVYDELDQLTHVFERTGNGNPVELRRFVYDDRGNRTAEYRDGRLHRTHAYDHANRILHSTSEGLRTAYGFDQSGLLVADGEHRLEYDAAHRLRRVINELLQSTTELAYSATGDLVLMTDGDCVERLAYDRLQEVIRDTGLCRANSFWCGWPDRPVAASSSGVAPTLIYTDATGSVIPSNDDKELFPYGPFGDSVTPEEPTHFGFEGKRFLVTVGAYFNRQRFYDPLSGRFLQPDPLGLVDGPNLYRYARNNPTTYGDPTGLTPEQHSQGRLTDLLLGLSYIKFPGQTDGRSYVAGPGLFESRPHIVHYDAHWNRLGRSDIVGPGWFETRPHVEHHDTNWDLVSRTYIQGPGMFESKPHAEHFDANWNRTGRSYIEGPGWLETHPHVSHYDANWNLQATTYTERPGLLGSLLGERTHLRTYGANGQPGSRTDIGAKGWLDTRSYFRHSAT